jgi:fructosamine-3-kinase
MWKHIFAEILLKTGKEFKPIGSPQAISGGYINQGYRLNGENSNYFVKFNDSSLLPMFESEALALLEINALAKIKAPLPISYGTVDQYSYLILEWLNLSPGNAFSWYEMGKQLANMHLSPMGKLYGWERSNFIGNTPQNNYPTEVWADFFAEQRIAHQLKIAKGTFKNTEKTIEQVRKLLKNHQPTPSLVHGDLWSGNSGFTSNSEPIILDPAIYYGDREVDIAMTELFGGYPANFYRGYNSIVPLDIQYQKRKFIYNLYHILNHYNLFGSRYLIQAEQTINQLF